MPPIAPFDVDSPDPLMVQRAVEDHESRVAVLEAISAGTTSYTRRIVMDPALFRIFDAVKDALPDSPGTDDMGLADAAASAAVTTTVSGGGTATATQKCLVRITLPRDYKAGGTLTLRLRAKLGGALQVSATIDAEAKVYSDGALGSDLVSTAAQALATNDTYANYDFTITPTSRVAGDILQVIVTIALDDTGGTASKFASLAAIELRYQGVEAQ